MMPSIAHPIALLIALCFSLSVVALPHNVFTDVAVGTPIFSTPGDFASPSPTAILIETVISGTTTYVYAPITPVPAPPPDYVTVISGTTVRLPQTYTNIGGTQVPVPIVPGPFTIVSGTRIPISTTALVVSGTTVPAIYTLTVVDGTTVVVPFTPTVVSGTTYTVPLTPYGVIDGTVVPAPSGVIIPTVVIPGGGGSGGGGSGGGSGGSGGGSGGSGGGGGPSAPGVDGAGGGGAPNVNLGLAIGIPVVIGALLALLIGVFWYRRRKTPATGAGYTAPAANVDEASGVVGGPAGGSGGAVPGGPATSYSNIPAGTDSYGGSGVPGGPGTSSGGVPGGPVSSSENYPAGPSGGGVPGSSSGPRIDMPLEGSHRLSGYDNFVPETSRELPDVPEIDAGKLAAIGVTGVVAGGAIYAATKKDETDKTSPKLPAKTSPVLPAKTTPASYQYATSQTPGTAPVTEFGNIARPISGGEYPSPGGVPGGPSTSTSDSPAENFDLSGNDAPNQAPNQGPNQDSSKAGYIAAGALGAASILALKKNKKTTEEEISENKDVDKPATGIPASSNAPTDTTTAVAGGSTPAKKRLERTSTEVFEEEEEEEEVIERKSTPIAEAPKEPERTSGLFDWVVGAITGRPASENRKSTASGSGSDVGPQVVETKDVSVKKTVTKPGGVAVEEEEIFYDEEVTEGGVTKTVRKTKTGQVENVYEEEITESKGGPSGAGIATGIATGIAVGAIAGSAVTKKKEVRKVRPAVEGVTVYEEEWEAIEEEESSNGTKTASRIVRETDSKTVYPVVNSVDVFDDETAAANAAKASKKIYTRVVTRTGKIIYILVPAASASLIKKRGQKTEIENVTIYSEEWEALEAAQNSGGKKTVTRIVHQTTGKVMYVLVSTDDVFDEEGPASASAKRTSKIVTKIVESTGKVKYVILPSLAAEAAGIIIKTTRTIRIVKNNEKGEQVGTEEVTIYEDETLATTEASKMPGRIVTRFGSTENMKQSFIVLTEQDYFTSEAAAFAEARKQGKVIVKREENGVVRWLIIHAPVANAVGATFIRPPAQPKSSTRTLRIVKNNEKGEQIGVDEVTIYEDEALATTAAATAGKRVIKLTESEKTTYLLLTDEEIFDDEASANTAARSQGKVIVRTEITPGVFKYIIIHAPVASTIKIKYTTPTRGPTTRTIRIVRTNEKNEQIGVDEVVLYDDKATALKSAGDRTIIHITDTPNKKTLYTAISKTEIFEEEKDALSSEKVPGKDLIQTIDASGQTVYALLHTPVISSLGLSAIKRDSVVSEYPSGVISRYASGVTEGSNVGERDISEFSEVEVEKLTSASVSTGLSSMPTVVVDRGSNVSNIRSSFESRSSNEGRRSGAYKTGRSFEGVVPEDIDVPDLSAYVPPAPTSHVVVSSYYPKLPDEMPLVVGDLIGVERQFEDGWARGQNITQGRRRGLFPLTSVTAIKSGPTQTVAKVGTQGESTNAGRYWLGWGSGSGANSPSSAPSSPVMSEAPALVVSPSDVAGAAYALAETRSPIGPAPPRTHSLVTTTGDTPPQISHIQMLEDQLPVSLPSK